MDKKKLNATTVDNADVPKSGESRVWDTELKGYCLRIYPSGRKVYALKFRLKGRQRWLTIGEHSEAMTPTAARKAAAAALLEVASGIDPTTVKRVRDDLTVDKLIDLYLEKGREAKPDKREISWKQDRSNLKRHVSPLLGKRLASGLGPTDMQWMASQIATGKTAKQEKTKARGVARVKGGSGTAARSYSTARAMFSWAIETKMMAGPNPCVGAPKLAARPAVERFLSEKQATTLLEAIRDLEAEGSVSARHAAIFRLLMMTGARRVEIAGLRWSEVDFDRARLVLPPERSKAGGKTGDRYITLSKPAVDLLRSLEPTKPGARFVFPATKGKSGHTTTEGKVWREKVLPRAKLTGVRIHDLRHSFASFALADGASLALIGKALGHASSRTTEKYAKLSDDPLRAMSELIGKRFAPAEPAEAEAKS